jgi:hypothetical protein
MSILVHICSFLPRKDLFCLRGERSRRFEDPVLVTRLARAAGENLFGDIIIAPRDSAVEVALNLVRSPHLVGKIKRVIYDNSVYDPVLARDLQYYAGAMRKLSNAVRSDSEVYRRQVNDSINRCLQLLMIA